jgi:hypothetical protein
LGKVRAKAAVSSAYFRSRRYNQPARAVRHGQIGIEYARCERQSLLAFEN